MLTDLRSEEFADLAALISGLGNTTGRYGNPRGHFWDLLFVLRRGGWQKAIVSLR